jgi:hypothetical protein
MCQIGDALHLEPRLALPIELPGPLVNVPLPDEPMEDSEPVEVPA